VSIGFGARYGVGATDRVDLAAFSLPSVYSVWIWSFVDSGNTSASIDTVLGRGSVRWIGLSTAPQLRIYAGNGTTYWGWTPRNLVWQGLGFTLDTTSSANDPTVYYDGVVLTTGSGLTQTGTDAAHITGSAITYFGNLSTNNRIGSGQLADFAVWDGALTPHEFARLQAGESPARIRPSSLVRHLPFGHDTKDTRAGALATINAGTAWRADRPSRIYMRPLRPQFGVEAAAGGEGSGTGDVVLGAAGAGAAAEGYGAGDIVLGGAGAGEETEGQGSGVGNLVLGSVGVGQAAEGAGAGDIVLGAVGAGQAAAGSGAGEIILGGAGVGAAASGSGSGDIVLEGEGAGTPLAAEGSGTGNLTLGGVGVGAAAEGAGAGDVVLDGAGSGPGAQAEESITGSVSWGKSKKKRLKVIRFSDFAVREDLVQEVRKAIPIPRPVVVQSIEDIEDEDFIVINLLGLIDD